MLKKLVNEAYFTLRITTTGPLLIKSGHATISGPDMTPVRTFHNKQEEVFLPGSSLKGVFRSHVEKIVCSLKPQVVCYPFFSSEDKKEDLVQRRQDYRDSCGAIFTELAKNNKDMRDKLETRTDYIYANSCPTCRLFGSTGFIGRLAISDAYLASDSNSVTEQRDGVGIDRLTGGASHGAKFELEVVSTGVIFETDIHLRNYEIWQLGMLFAVLQDMQDELIRIGSGRSRGLGQIKAEISQQGRQGRLGGFVTSSLRRGKNSEEPTDQLWGLGCWLGDQAEHYGTRQDDYIQLEDTVQPIPRGIRNLRVFEGDALNKLQNAAIKKFVERMQDWPKPEIPITLNNR